MGLKFLNFLQGFFRQTCNTKVMFFEAFNDFKFTLIVFINSKQL